MPPEEVGRILWFIIGTVIILFGAYYVTYFIGMKASGRTRAGLRNRNIVVRDMYSISRDKSFCVVEIAGKVYIVGVSASSMTLLDTIEAQEFEEYLLQNETNPGGAPMMPWTDTPVGRYGNKLTKKVALFIATKLGRAPQQDFSETMKEAERQAQAKAEQQAEKAERRTAAAQKNTSEGDK